MAVEEVGDIMRKITTLVLDKARAFLRNKRGNVAMMFGIALVPLTIAAGVGLDYARQAMVKNAMSEALDAAALAVGSTNGLTQAQAKTLAQSYLDASYKNVNDSTAPKITDIVYSSTGSVTLTATSQLPATLLKIAGYSNLPVSTSSTVVWGQSKLWVALALDNSGSMAQGDSTGSKMDALQNALTTASTGLLAVLKAAAASEGDVKVTLVPFANLVNVNGAISSSYLDWREWDAQPPLGTGYMTTTATINGIPFQAYGPGADCPFDGTDGYYCISSSTNDDNCSSDNHGSHSDCIDTIPSGGGICPSMHGYSDWQDGSADRFYNGCYTSTKSGTSKVTWTTTRTTDCNHFPSSATCSYTGSGSTKTYTSQKYTHTWTVNAHSTWGGCVADRQKSGSTTYGATSSASSDYDTYNTTPSSGDSLFPALNTDSCLSAVVVPLPTTWTTSQWTTLSTKINAMSPGGSTNQAIGIEHAWQTLTPGNPYGAPTVPTNTGRYIIIFSDGQNTQDRWNGDGRTESTTADADIDTRTTDACAHAKTDGIIIYSIYVNVGGKSGNSAPLKTCASDTSKYYALTSTSAIVTTFAQIAQQITNVRVSK